MINVYAPTYRAVKTAQVLENSALEGREYVDAQVKLARVAFAAYDTLRTAASSMPLASGLSQKEAMVANVLSLAVSLHDAHVDTGAKVAAAPDTLASVIQKLATAVFVDEVLMDQLNMLEGESKVAAEQCQQLGREYILSLIGEILP